MKKTLRLLLAAFALAAFSGCAGVVEFRTPKEFEDGKKKEDPPVGSLPARPVQRPA